MHRVGGKNPCPIINLAYLQKNNQFSFLNENGKYYTLPDDSGTLTEELRSLGYGDELSKIFARVRYRDMMKRNRDMMMRLVRDPSLLLEHNIIFLTLVE